MNSCAMAFGEIKFMMEVNERENFRQNGFHFGNNYNLVFISQMQPGEKYELVLLFN